MILHLTLMLLEDTFLYMMYRLSPIGFTTITVIGIVPWNEISHYNKIEYCRNANEVLPNKSNIHLYIIGAVG